MRQFVFAFSFVFLFVQSMQPAYAVLPLLNVAGATFRAGGALLKGSKFVKGTNYAFVGATMAWCYKNKKKCLDLGGDIAEDVINNHENDCIVHFGNYDSHLSLNSYISSILSKNRQDAYGEYKYSLHSNTISTLQSYEKAMIDRYSDKNFDNWIIATNAEYLVKKKYSHSDDYSTSLLSTSVFVKCSNSNDDADEISNELFEKIKDKISDDDAKDIINNYYNETENTFNIEQYCATSNSCLDIDNDFSKELNTKDYDYTKISKENCEVENDKIVSCEKAKKTKSDDDDDSDNTNQDDKKDKDDDSNNTNNSHNTDKKDDDSDNQKIKCNSSEFHKKVCDFIDWYQDDDLNTDDDTKVKVKDLSDDLSIDDDRIKFGRSCPTGPVVSISFKMVNINYQISYEGLCQAFEKMRPFVIGIGGLVSVMIIGGRRV